jgi:hypothetical protein
VLSTLIRHDHVPPWLRSHLVHALALLPLRTRGVRDTVEFIFQVHPSTVQKTSAGQSQTADSRGSSISLEALNAASLLISAPPSNFSPDAWFSAIAPQLFALLDGEGGLELVKAASFIIGYGILGRKALGAPGMGINVQKDSFTDFLMKARLVGSHLLSQYFLVSTLL